jgi:TRAP-type mannitol/chloroaromatic compound transport system permease small subunit
MVVVVIALSWPLVVSAFVSGEVSSNAGGLIRWPVMALVPLGFGLLGLQGLSELIKCVGYLRGMLPEPSGIRGQGTSAPKAKP